MCSKMYVSEDVQKYGLFKLSFQLAPEDPHRLLHLSIAFPSCVQCVCEGSRKQGTHTASCRIHTMLKRSLHCTFYRLHLPSCGYAFSQSLSQPPTLLLWPLAHRYEPSGKRRLQQHYCSMAANVVSEAKLTKIESCYRPLPSRPDFSYSLYVLLYGIRKVASYMNKSKNLMAPNQHHNFSFTNIEQFLHTEKSSQLFSTQPSIYRFYFNFYFRHACINNKMNSKYKFHYEKVPQNLTISTCYKPSINILKESLCEVQCWLVINIFYQSPIMYKIKSTNDIITFQNQQCTCFGSTDTSQEQFLAKQKTFQGAPLFDTNAKNYNHERSFLKSNFKKSLKKQLSPFSSFAKKMNTPNPDIPIESKSQNPLEKTPEIREFMSPQNKPIQSTFKTFMVPTEPFSNYYAAAIQPREIISCKNIPQFLPNYLPPPPTITNFHSPAKTIKINYQNSPTTYTSPQKRTFSPISTSTCIPKEANCPATYLAKHEGYNNSPNFKAYQQKQEADRSQSTKIISKGQNQQPMNQKDETSKSCVKISTLKSGIGLGKQKIQFSRIETGKSIVGTHKGKHEGKRQGETGKSRIDIKSLKEHKNSLKKMDDVQEIYSLPDSEELSDSDKQSVVLGRLNQYGSMIEPALSQISQHSEPKIMRLNSLSLKIQKGTNYIDIPSNFVNY